MSSLGKRWVTSPQCQTLPSTSCALGLSFSRDARWRTGKSQICPGVASGQDLDPGTDPAGVHQIPVDCLSEKILLHNSIPL